MVGAARGSISGTVDGALVGVKMLLSRSWRGMLPRKLGIRRRGAVVLMYHRIADVPIDPSGTAVSPERFVEQMESLAGWAVPSPLLSLVEGERRASERTRSVVVTFDDGYLENLTFVAPVLERLGIPATFFIPVCAVDAADAFWWDELEEVVFGADALPPRLDIDVAGRRLSAAVNDDGGEEDRSGRHRDWRAWRGDARTPRQRLFTLLWSELLRLPDADQRHLVDGIRTWAGHSPARREGRGATLTSDGLAALGGTASRAIGAHTLSHPWLTTLDPARLWEEVDSSRRRLRELGVGEVGTFAYPYGAHDDDTVEAVRRAGFSAAVTTEAGAVHGGTDPLRIPRLDVGDWTAAAFRAELSGWLP